MTLRIVLSGEESAGRLALQALQAAGLPPLMVLTSPAADHPGGLSLAGLAQRAGIPVLSPRLVRSPDFARDLIKKGVDLLLNVHSLHLVHDDVAAAPRIGCFNLHPGPLPDYAGLNAPSWAIANGEPSHGVTLHWMDSGVDTGPIAYQDRFPIRPNDTGLVLCLRCVQHGIPLITQLVAAAAADPARIPVIPQDTARRRYFRRGPPNDGRINWDAPAAEIDRLIRAFDYTPLSSPWGRPTCLLDGRPVEIRKVETTGQPCDEAPGSVRQVGDAVMVASADEWLHVVSIAIEGERAPPLSLVSGSRLAMTAMFGLLL